MDPTGYVRLTIRQLARVRLVLLTAAADDQLLVEVRNTADSVRQAGYCEWVDSHWSPPITIGWCWSLDAKNRYGVVPDSLAFNLAIVSADGYDFGPALTALCLRSWLDTWSWISQLESVLNLPNT